MEPTVFPEKRSPPDNRDWVAETIYPATRDLALPKELDLRVSMNPPRNQGTRGTCAAFTASAIKEYQERKDIAYGGYMSPEFIYYFRENKPDEGMYGRNVMQILSTSGSCFETDLPYKNSDIAEIPEDVKTKATNYRIKSYAQVNTIEGLKKALYKNGPCYISFPVYSNRPEVWRAKPTEQSVGGHAMTVVGYTTDGFIIRNSWGSFWNGTGCVIYPYSEFGVHWEIWTLIDDQSVRKDLPKPKLLDVLKRCLHRSVPE